MMYVVCAIPFFVCLAERLRRRHLICCYTGSAIWLGKIGTGQNGKCGRQSDEETVRRGPQQLRNMIKKRKNYTNCTSKRTFQ